MITDKQINRMSKHLTDLHDISDKIDPIVLAEMIQISEDPRAEKLMPLAQQLSGLTAAEFASYVSRIKMILFFVIEFRKLK